MDDGFVEHAPAPRTQAPPMPQDHPSPGILAIWNDCARGTDAEFEHWFQSEHLAERLAVPGFRLGRRHEAVSGSPRYFVFYRTDTPEVLTSRAYLDRVNDPTPLTRKVMAEVFRNMSRTVCRLAHRVGSLSGAFTVTVRLQGEPDAEHLKGLAARLGDDDGVAGAEVWIAAEAGRPAPSAEEVLRGGDARIAGCLCVQTLRLEDARRIRSVLAAEVGEPREIGIYRFLCERRPAGD
jgi:hypothetical protein